jgi:nucleotide-binding universal stress UspA family protein
MLRKLLIAYDGSTAARAAFDFGSDLALKYGAELHVLAVAHRGRTLFDRLLVGSVARQVVAHARCGVSVLR